MTDEEIIAALKSGAVCNFGCNSRNLEVMALMNGLQEQGLISLTDMGLSQETRMEARWIGAVLVTQEGEA